MSNDKYRKSYKDIDWAKAKQQLKSKGVVSRPSEPPREFDVQSLPSPKFSNDAELKFMAMSRFGGGLGIPKAMLVTGDGSENRQHLEGCNFRRACDSSTGVECVHGRDVCEECDPCTCDKIAEGYSSAQNTGTGAADAGSALHATMELSANGFARLRRSLDSLRSSSEAASESLREQARRFSHIMIQPSDLSEVRERRTMKPATKAKIPEPDPVERFENNERQISIEDDE